MSNETEVNEEFWSCVTQLVVAEAFLTVISVHPKAPVRTLITLLDTIMCFGSEPWKLEKSMP